MLMYYLSKEKRDYGLNNICCLARVGICNVGASVSTYRLHSQDLWGDETVQLYGAIIHGQAEMLHLGYYVSIDHQKVSSKQL